MGRQEDSCWRCGTQWVENPRPVQQLHPTAPDADHGKRDGESSAPEVTLPLSAIAAVR
jgi:hypothetical protein